MLLKKIIRGFITFIIFLYIPFLCFCQNFGTSTAEFLKINPDAEAEGMGEAYISQAEGTTALIYNPSGLSMLDRSEISLTELLWFNSLYIEHAAIAFPFTQGFAIGGNVLWFDTGKFDSTGYSQNAISIQDGLFNIGLGYSILDNIHIGGSAKLIYENNFGNTLLGTSCDLGAIFNIIGNNFSGGIVIKNLGFLSGTSDLLPYEAGAGLNYSLYDGKSRIFSLNFDFDKILNTDNIYAAIGAEVLVFNTLYLRLGAKYNNALSIDFNSISFSNVESLMILSAGFGLNLGNLFSLDYAFTPMGDLGPVQRVTLKFKFGPSMSEASLYAKSKEAIVAPKSMEIPKIETSQGQIKEVSFKPQVAQEQVKEWTLQIKTSDGKIVKTFSGVGEVPKNIAWNGTDSYGKIAAAGVGYIYDFKAKNTAGKIIENTGKISETSTTNENKFDFMNDEVRYIPQKNKEILVVPMTLLISSNTDERKTVPFVMVNTEIKKVRGWEFTIKDKNGEVVRSYKGDGDVPSYLVWDGKNMQGEFVPDSKMCKYTLSITGDKGEQAEITTSKVIRDPFTASSYSKVVKLTKKIYFETDSAIIAPEMYERLAQIADEIKGYGATRIYIQGHSSKEGDNEHNLTLSYERAQAVLKYLVEVLKIEPYSLNAIGYGTEIPTASNDNEEGRAKNRRVEIVLIAEKNVK